MHAELYSASVTSVPFLVLALVAQTNAFGPLIQGRHRRQRHAFDATADGFALLALAVAFAAALVALGGSVDEPLLRWAVGLGLGIGGVGVFAHATGSVYRLYQPTRTEGGHGTGGRRPAPHEATKVTVR